MEESQAPQLKEFAFRAIEIVRSLGLESGIDLVLALLYIRGSLPEVWEHLARDHGPAQLSVLLTYHLRSQGAPEAFLRGVGDDGGGALQGSLDLVAGIQPDRLSLSSAFETVLEARAGRLGRASSESETPVELAELMAGAVVHPGDTVLDPACGIGNTLIAAAHRGAGCLNGVDLSQVVLWRVRMRLDLAGRPHHLTAGDSLLTYPTERADAVVLHPPWGLRRAAGLDDHESLVPQASVDLQWVDRAVSQLDRDGRAAILLPAGTSSRGGRDGSGRQRLLELGVVEAVISFPSGTLPDMSVASCLWVVRAPGTSRPDSSVLVANAASWMERAARGTMALPLEASDRLVEILWAWRNGTTPSGPAHVLAVIPLARIAESDWVLSPERYLEPVPVETVPRPQAPHRLLSRLSVSGFKSFGPPQEAHLRPITLIYGANSAGKSSFIQSLLLMKQSIGAASLVTQGAVTDAGSFTGALHRHEAESRMEFRLRFGSNESWSLDPLGAPDPSLTRHVALSFGADLSGLPKQAAVMIASAEWIMTFASEPSAADGVGLLGISLDELAGAMDAIATGTALYPFDARRGGEAGAEEEKRLKARRSNANRVLRALSRAGVERVVVERDGLLPSARWRRTHLEAIGDKRLASVAESYVKRALQLAVGTAHEFRQLLDGLTYLGPLRSAPQRFYNRAALASGSSTSGEHVALYLFDNISEVDLVNEWLARLGVPYAVKVAPLAAAGTTHIVGDLVAMILTDLRSGVEVSPADVGFGVSQLLPIVVELLARSNSVLCIEQPEIHLHPALQTELGDLLIEATSATGRANQVLVETHSEHLVLRLQRRIREGTLDPEDVAVLYVDQDAEGEARISRLALGGDGSFLDEWPHGFFEERLDELFGGGE